MPLNEPLTAADLAPDQLLTVQDGLVVVDPAAFASDPVAFLRLVLAPISIAEPRDDEGIAGRPFDTLPFDVALTIARARDAGTRDVRLREWTLGASTLAAGVPRFLRVPGSQFDEYEDGVLEDVVVLATDDDGNMLYWRLSPGEGRLFHYVAAGRYEPADGTFATEILRSYEMLVSSLRFAANLIRTRTNPSFVLEPDASNDDSLKRVLDTCAALRAPIDASCRMPRWLCLGSLSSQFRAILSHVNDAALLHFLEAGVVLAENDAAKARVEDRRHRFDLLGPWRIAFAFEALGDERCAPGFAAVRTRLEHILERRCAQEARDDDGRRWRYPQAWE